MKDLYNGMSVNNFWMAASKMQLRKRKRLLIFDDSKRGGSDDVKAKQFAENGAKTLTSCR